MQKRKKAGIKKGQTAIKWISKRAQDIRKENPNKKWKECIRAASADYRKK